MNVQFRRNIFLLLAFIAGAIVVVLTLFLITCLHIVKFFFNIFFQREKLSSKSKGLRSFQYTESTEDQAFDAKQRPIKTIEAEVVSAESKSTSS